MNEIIEVCNTKSNILFAGKKTPIPFKRVLEEIIEEVEEKVMGPSSSKKRGRPPAKRKKSVIVSLKDINVEDKSVVLPKMEVESFKKTVDYSRRSESVEILKIDKDIYLEAVREFAKTLDKKCEVNLSKQLLQEKISKKEAELKKLKTIRDERYKKKTKSWYDGGEDEEDEKR